MSFRVLVDWLTLATWDFTAYVNMAALIRRDGEKWKKSKVMQYEGWTNGEIFHGRAYQAGKEHYMIRASGSGSDELCREIIDFPERSNADLFYCTRIDLQRTIPSPSEWKPREIYDWIVEQKSGTSSVIESETGSTVYVGARASDRFTRMYEKNYEKLYVRLEIELKGEYSRFTWAKILADGMTILPEMYTAHLQRINVPQWVKVCWQPMPDTDMDIREHERLHNEGKQLKWLQSLMPTFRKMANSHEIGGRARDIFYSLSVEVGNER